MSTFFTGRRVVGDLVILIDGTSTVDEKNFTLARQVAADVVSKFYLSEDTLQVSYYDSDE